MSEEHVGWSSVPNWVIRSNTLQGTEKLLYIALLNRANARGECWPSLATLANDVGASTRTVLRKLEDLEVKGLIRKTRRANAAIGNVSNMYRVLPFKGPHPSDKLSPPSDNEHHPLVTECHHPSDNELQEVLPSEVLHRGSTTQLSARDFESLFDAAYSRWPKKVERKKSLEKFIQACKKRDPDGLVADIVRFGDAYAATTEVRFVPALVTWLNGERWTDALPQPRGQQQYTRTDQAHDFISRLEAIDAASGGGEAPRGHLELGQSQA